MELILHSLKQFICEKWIFLLLFENVIIHFKINLVNANEKLDDLKQWDDFKMEDQNALWDVESGPWLDVFEDTAKSVKNVPHYIQGDDPGGGQIYREIPVDPDAPTRCPDVPDRVNSLASLLPNCTANIDCILPFQLCCFNGRIKTCLTGVKASAVVDWQVQPLAIDEEKHGDAWLIHDDEKGDNVTTGSCVFKKRIIPDAADFIYQRHPCYCLGGEVYCSVKGDMPHDQLPEDDFDAENKPISANKKNKKRRLSM